MIDFAALTEMANQHAANVEMKKKLRRDILAHTAEDWIVKAHEEDSILYALLAIATALDTHNKNTVRAYINREWL